MIRVDSTPRLADVLWLHCKAAAQNQSAHYNREPG